MTKHVTTQKRVSVISHAHHLQEMAQSSDHKPLKTLKFQVGMYNFADLKRRIEVYHTLSRELEFHIEDTTQYTLHAHEQISITVQSSLPILEHMNKISVIMEPTHSSPQWRCTAAYRYLEDQCKATFRSLERTYNLLMRYVNKLIPCRAGAGCPLIAHANKLQATRSVFLMLRSIAQPITQWFCWLQEVTKALLRQIVPKSSYIALDDPLLASPYFRQCQSLPR